MTTVRRLAPARPPRAGDARRALARHARPRVIGAGLCGALAGLAAGLGVLAAAPAVRGAAAMDGSRFDATAAPAPARAGVPAAVASIASVLAPTRRAAALPVRPAEDDGS